MISFPSDLQVHGASKETPSKTAAKSGIVVGSVSVDEKEGAHLMHGLVRLGMNSPFIAPINLDNIGNTLFEASIVLSPFLPLDIYRLIIHSFCGLPDECLPLFNLTQMHFVYLFEPYTLEIHIHTKLGAAPFSTCSKTLLFHA